MYAMHLLTFILCLKVDLVLLEIFTLFVLLYITHSNHLLLYFNVKTNNVTVCEIK